ncbi:hypothetical protein [Anaerorhabdus sp.]|uniref:hypothetical protein n=1 Tax=Anaerorhabdus sp. TaxID=1872524 RepID=UPI002FC89129
MSVSNIKESYRSEIERLSHFVKISVVCKEVGISQSAMSYFLKQRRYELLSVNKLQSFMNYVQSNT